jgi:DNA-binding transcriptional ArsR family regulator
MKYIVIAPMGDHMESLFVGIKEFPTEKIVLISSESRRSEAEAIKKDMDKFKIPTHIMYIEGKTEIEIWESTFKAIAEIRSAEKDKEILVNVATGDRVTRCAATSAAFVNGFKAFATSGQEAMMLPVMKFSYYKLIPDKKMDILKIISEKDCCASLDELSKKTGMSLPLISYHINGNLKSEGLKTMGLVDTKEEKGRVSVDLSPMGRMIVKGYIEQAPVK